MNILDLEIDERNVEGSFDIIANEIFNTLILECGNGKYRLTEIEFYYFNSKVHPDPYAHKHELQLTNKKWYFHPSGLDITFGNKDSYCGILIRGLINIETKGEVYGPLNLVTELLKNISTVAKHKIELGFSKGDFEYQIIKKAKRVGIKSLKSPEYFEKKYRYLIYPEKKHRNKFDYQ